MTCKILDSYNKTWKFTEAVKVFFKHFANMLFS